MIPYNFTNNFDPTNTKEAKVRFRLDYTDTPFTVKSNGITLNRYLITNTSTPDFSGLTNLTLVDSLTTDLIGFYSEDGAMLGMHYTDNFALHYTGYFYSDHPFDAKYYSFKVYGYGYVRVKINSKYVIGSTNYEALEPLQYATGHISLTPKTWNTIDVYYYTTLGEAGFSLLWASAYYGLEDSNYIPVSAGVLSKNGSYLVPAELPNVVSVSREESKGEVGSLKFRLPLVVSGSSEEGYYYNSYWNKYCHTTDNIALSKFRMVEFYAGYRPTSYPTDDDDIIKKFIGHIESFKPSRDETSNFLDVSCVSFESLMKQTINLNYPNIYDYWNASYAGNQTSESNPDGKGCPTTYDGWELPQVMKSLFIRGHIDPYLFLKKRLHLNNANQVVSGTWLIEETSPLPVVLDTSINYGNSLVVNTIEGLGSTADDIYIQKSQFGEYLLDYANKITDVYGWQWGCNPYYDGAPYLKSNNNPYVVYKTKDGLDSEGLGAVVAGNGFMYGVDINTISGKYLITNEENDYVDFIFKGSKASLVIVGDTDSGFETFITSFSSDYTSITVEDATGISTFNIIIVETDGGDDAAVVNSVSSNTVTLLTPLNYRPTLNGYVRMSTFSATLKRGTSYASGTLVQTTYHSCYFNNDYNRLVLTNNYGDKSPTYLTTKRVYYDGIDPKTSVNPTLIKVTGSLTYDTYVLRVKRLLDSQVGATNYMKIDALLVFDRDTDQIAETFYTGDSVVSGTVIALNVDDSGVDIRNDTLVVGRMLGVDVPGGGDGAALNPNNPTYEYILSRATDIASIYDPNARNYVGFPKQTIQIAPEIASVDRANYWSVSFINRYRKGNRFPEFMTLGNPLMEIGDCISVKDEGKELLETNDKFWIEAIEETYDIKKYISSYTTTTYPPWESYTPRNIPDPSDFGNLPIANFSITNGGDGNADNLTIPLTSAYDPYSSDAEGTKVIIKYDLVVDGYVRVDIYPVERPDLLVATLLNPTGSSGPEGWQKQDVGKNYVVTWDGVDIYGKWNLYCTEKEDLQIGKGYFAHEGINAVNGKGKFFVKITVVRRNVSVPLIVLSSDSKLLGTNGYIYTKRANVTSVDFISDPRCRFFDWRPPIVCFTDSKKDIDGYPMAAKLIVSDSSQNVSVRTNLLGQNYHGERFTTNRKISVKITATNIIVFYGQWYVGGHLRTSITSPPQSQSIYYDDASFSNYGSGNEWERYVNIPASGYKYDDYERYAGSAWVNNIKAGAGRIYVGWYIFVELEAYDKSGRRVLVMNPSPNGASFYDTTSINGVNGVWLFWIDDKYPYPPVTPGSVGQPAYEWTAINTSDSKNKLIDSNGVDILSSSTYGIGSKMYMIKIYDYNGGSSNTKIDVYGNPWGY